jgi:hypothetical protein
LVQQSKEPQAAGTWSCSIAALTIWKGLVTATFPAGSRAPRSACFVLSGQPKLPQRGQRSCSLDEIKLRFYCNFRLRGLAMPKRYETGCL